jgi:hypothetical protein
MDAVGVRGGPVDVGHGRFGCLEDDGRCRDVRDDAEKRGRFTFGSDGKSVSISSKDAAVQQHLYCLCQVNYRQGNELMGCIPERLSKSPRKL